MREAMVVESPVGRLLLEAVDGAVTTVAFDGPEAVSGPAGPTVERAARELAEYFRGERTAFELPLAAKGTAWEARVWGALVEIPYGETASYADVARRTGNPKGTRAVGRANGRNPIAIVVPCHRVVGADGTLVGYGGGLPRKTWLLEHERRVRARGAG